MRHCLISCCLLFALTACEEQNPQLLGPVPYRLESMSYAASPSRNQVVIFGGASESSYSSHVWFYQDNEYVLATPNRSVRPRTGAAVAYDELRNAFYAFGGIQTFTETTGSGDSQRTTTTVTVFDDLFIYPDTTKTSTTWLMFNELNVKPEPRYGAALLHDPEEDRIIMWGGWDRNRAPFPPNEYWIFNNQGWQKFSDGP